MPIERLCIYSAFDIAVIAHGSASQICIFLAGSREHRGHKVQKQSGQAVGNRNMNNVDMWFVDWMPIVFVGGKLKSL